MQQLSSPKGNHIARICLVPKTSKYVHLRASEVLCKYMLLCFEWFMVRVQSRTSESVLFHQSPHPWWIPSLLGPVQDSVRRETVLL